MDDGSLSEDEYRKLATDLMKKQAALNEERRQLALMRVKADSRPIAAALTAAIGGNRTTLDYTHSPPTARKSTGLLNDIDVQIHGIHNIPTCVRPQVAANLKVSPITPGMAEQMDTGNYPTVEQHLAGMSPAYEPMFDKTGLTGYRKHDRESIYALRSRTNHRPLR